MYAFKFVIDKELHARQGEKFMENDYYVTVDHLASDFVVSVFAALESAPTQCDVSSPRNHVGLMSNQVTRLSMYLLRL